MNHTGSVLVPACLALFACAHDPLSAGGDAGDGAAGADGSASTGAPPDLAPASVDLGMACVQQEARPARWNVPRRASIALYRWTGLQCRYTIYDTERDELGVPKSPPLGCSGADCGSLWVEEAACIAHYAMCGARHESPQRGEPFVGIARLGVQCGGPDCPPGQECSFEITPNCRPADPGVPRRLRCDDILDCAQGTSCCVTEDGPYLVSSCLARCDPPRNATACSTDAECGPAERCCTAHPRYAVTASWLGVCTDHACEPALP